MKTNIKQETSPLLGDIIFDFFAVFVFQMVCTLKGFNVSLLIGFVYIAFGFGKIVFIYKTGFHPALAMINQSLRRTPRNALRFQWPSFTSFLILAIGLQFSPMQNDVNQTLSKSFEIVVEWMIDSQAIQVIMIYRVCVFFLQNKQLIASDFDTIST